MPHVLRRTPAAAVPLALAVVVLLGPACSDEDNDDVQVPNPASVFCEEEGGTVDIVTDPDGSQRGICVLATGERVDEWEYFREHGGD